MEQRIANADETVLARMAAGERQALTELYMQYRGQLLAYLRALIDDPGLAEEVMQDTLLAAWSGAASYERRASVRLWLLGIARRRAHEALRRRTLMLLDVTVLETVAAPDPEPESLALLDVEREALHTALQRLSPHHREVLVLNFVQELTYREIAQVSGVPIGTVMSRLHHAKRALRIELLEMAADD